MTVPKRMRPSRPGDFQQRGWYCGPHDAWGCRCEATGNSLKYTRARDRRDAERAREMLGSPQ